jgi:hypothetical protein
LSRRETKFVNEYDVYHDESQIAGYWHGIMFVQRHSRSQLLALLEQIRKNTACFNPVSLKNLEKLSGRSFRCITCWMAVGVASLIQSFKGRHYALPTGKEGRWAEFRPLSDVLSTRFVLFRVKGGLGPLTLCHDYAAKVEATFRMAFKGGLTMFARQGEELCIRSLHFDGYKHYKRRLDLHRILRKIGTPPRGVHLHREIVLGDGTSDHRDRDAQPYADCQLLQLTDLLVSGFRTVLGQSTSDAQRRVCAPLAELASKWDRGLAGFKNSRWYKGFCISEGCIEDGEWRFGRIEAESGPLQGRLFASHG